MKPLVKYYGDNDMKTINITLYTFDELSEEVQKQIIEKERWNIMEQCMDAYSSDYRASLEKFDTLMGTEACDYSVDYCSYNFDYKISDMAIYVNPIDCDKDIYPEDLCGKLLFRYINNNIMPYITKGKYYATRGKYIDGKYKYKHRRSRVILKYDDNWSLTGTCYDFYLLKPIIDYYDTWCTYSEKFSLEDLIGQCYNSFFKAWHEEYEYWADDEDAIREELHNNQYEDRLYYKNGDVYDRSLNEIA